MISLRRTLLGSSLALFFLLVGCPHRSPVFSPDGKSMLLLTGRKGEDIEKPASSLWLLRKGEDTWRPTRLEVPAERPEGKGIGFLAATWLDNSRFFVFAAQTDEGEAIADTVTIWQGKVGSQEFTRVEGAPLPSAEKLPRRRPRALETDAGAFLVYNDSDGALVAWNLRERKVALRREVTDVVGHGPQGGIVAFSPDEDTGEVEVLLISRDLKVAWKRKLVTDVAAKLGVKRSDIIYNDVHMARPFDGGTKIELQLVYAYISWKDGVAGYHVVLDASDGSLLSVAAGTACPGQPGMTRTGERELLAWHVAPATEQDREIGVIRARRPGKTDAPVDVSRKLSEWKKSAIHGYSLSPDRETLAVVVNDDPSRLLLYPIENGAALGEPDEIVLEAR